jgi:hypothetical protein
VKHSKGDGGSEFMADCAYFGLGLFVLPARSPELNGAVERCNVSRRSQFHACNDLPLTIPRIAERVDAFQNLHDYAGQRLATSAETAEHPARRPIQPVDVPLTVQTLQDMTAQRASGDVRQVECRFPQSTAAPSLQQLLGTALATMPRRSSHLPTIINTGYFCAAARSANFYRPPPSPN